MATEDIRSGMHEEHRAKEPFHFLVKEAKFLEHFSLHGKEIFFFLSKDVFGCGGSPQRRKNPKMSLEKKISISFFYPRMSTDISANVYEDVS
ncbi:hypothetical protein EBZ80_13705 [bacterium]|nr:hypothetical protein [bacterium]